MTDQTIEQEIQAKGLTAPRVTPAQIDALVARVSFRYNVVGTSTFCHAFLDDTFFLASGHAACVSKENFNAELGQKNALENVLKPMRDKLWELEGYALRSKLAGASDQAVLLDGDLPPGDQRWICTDDLLPERVDVIMYSPDMRNPCEQLIGRLMDGEWCSAGYRMVNVTHWMPLAAAPKVSQSKEALNG